MEERKEMFNFLVLRPNLSYSIPAHSHTESPVMLSFDFIYYYFVFFQVELEGDRGQREYSLSTNIHVAPQLPTQALSLYIKTKK